ncbi:hypothetical protein Flavo103_06870 [Flavobacterium collinsii]|uniref:hypothetical protein n=1 Tax=Flavobacterium collinsii TaxID=1114861 RepID=UPI0022CA7EAE|nr:hypothetical protein [Flavobacterium collinsii]GIQ57551.1 hypothetical protein Flavo103_06870 [Flavobacterium collinsii]
MNLENLNLVELNVKELQEIDGGDPFLAFIGLGALIIGIGLLSNKNRKINGPSGNGNNDPSGYYKGDLLTNGMF